MSSVVFEEGENASLVEFFHGWSRWCVKLTTVMGGESFPIRLGLNNLNRINITNFVWPSLSFKIERILLFIMFITIFFPGHHGIDRKSWMRKKLRDKERDTDDVRHSAIVYLVDLKTIIFSFNFSFLYLGSFRRCWLSVCIWALVIWKESYCV